RARGLRRPLRRARRLAGSRRRLSLVTTWHRTPLGHGIGLRLAHFGHLLEHGVSGVDWFEIISENFFEPGGRPRAVLEKVRAAVPVVMHGVSMGLGSIEPVPDDYLRQLRQLADRI